MMNVKKTPRVIVIASLFITSMLFLTGCAITSAINVSGESTDNNLLTDESVNFLDNDSGSQYYWVFEDNNCVLYSTDTDNNKTTAKQLAVFSPIMNDNNEPTLNSIINFGICGDWIIVSVGHYEGTAQYFYGDFVRLKKDGSNLEHFWLTDDDTFIIVDDWVYYNFWTVKGSDNEGVYRIRPDGTDNEYMGDIFHSIFLYADDGYVYGEKDTGKTIDKWNPVTDLIRCNPDGGGLVTLFSGDSLPKFENSDYMLYSDIEADDEYVAFTVSVHGYAEGDIWWGHFNYIADYRVNKDGSNLTLLREEYPVSSATDESVSHN